MPTTPKDYSSISPSAKSLLWLKAMTDIPFARTTARLVFGEADLPIETEETLTLYFLRRLLHFEARYWSIDAALKMLSIANILEISSGFSFRGLERVLYEDFFYIDTDLPEVIATKESLLKPLLRTLPEAPVGHLVLKPLNALDETAFLALCMRFPPGRLVVVNEGLLVYLDEKEKRKLCSTIRAVLKQRGGFWITADVYIRKEEKEEGAALAEVSPAIATFVADHRVNENKFSSFEEAEAFFKSCGLKISSIVEADKDNLRSLTLLKEKAMAAFLKGAGDSIPLITYPRIRETWILEVEG